MKKRFLIFAAGTLSGLCLMALLAPVRSIFFEFCTTKAYGWPALWRIDYCLCYQGGGTVYPARSLVVNGAFAVWFGVLGSLLVMWLDWRVRRRWRGQMAGLAEGPNARK